MPREYTNRLLALCDCGVLDHKSVLENLAGNWLSEDEVKRFATTEYEELIEEEV